MMKKVFLLSLTLALAPAVTLQAQSVATLQSQVQKVQKALGVELDPTAVLQQAMKLPNFIVRQDIVLKDGRSLEVYYKRNNDVVEVYSPNSPKDYTLDDTKRIKSSKFEIVAQVKGKLYRKSTLQQLQKQFNALAKRSR